MFVPSWSKRTYYNGVFYQNQRIWWHDGEECGKKVSKGSGKGYWKIGTFWDYSFALGAMDTLDANPSVQGPPYSYDHHRNVWSFWDWKSESQVVGWVGPTREIKVNCVLFEGDDPCKSNYILLF